MALNLKKQLVDRIVIRRLKVANDRVLPPGRAGFGLGEASAQRSVNLRQHTSARAQFFLSQRVQRRGDRIEVVMEVFGLVIHI